MVTIDSVVRTSPQQVACELGDEVVILSLANGTYYGLDPIAGRVWTLLGEGRSLGAIRDTLLDEYSGVDYDQCTRDVLALVEQLLRCDLVQVDEPPS